MSGYQRNQPKLADGYISRNEEGGFRGAGGYVGVNETVGGTNLQAINIGGEFGWGGDRGLYGARANATLAGVQHDPAAAGESGFWGGIRTFDAGAGAYYDSEAGVGEIGYRADIISGEVGYREVDPNSAADRGVRGGLALGAPSGGVRVYNQDADDDGRREYGLGLSVPVGPVGVSLDYTTETPIGDLAMMAIPGAGLINEGMEAIGLEEYAPASMIQSAAETGWDYAKQGAGAASDWVGSWFD